MKIKHQFRQGDVLIERIKEIPNNAIKQPGQVILAHGEVTGHAHEIDQDKADAWKCAGDAVEDLYISANSQAVVTHQEHDPIPLKHGKYKVTRQREYSPESIRNVAD